jgi:coenzyme F420 biosynthesis associated uncharacterized protein
MVDWTLARQVARLAAGSDQPVDLGADLRAVAAEMEGPVTGYTRLVPSSPVPPAEVVSRSAWAEANIGSMSGLLDPVAARLDGRFDSAGPLAGALRAGAGATLAAEVGLVMGYVSQRVLGQYEISLLGGDAPPRLLLVAPNLRNAVRDLDVDAGDFYRWICAHELTHVLQFQGVPWLRGHLGGMVRSYLESVEVRIDSGAAGGLPSLPDLTRIVDQFREGGLAALVQTEEQRDLMGRMQAAMSVVEGYSEHVMDVLAADLIPTHAELRAAMDRRRRSKSAPERLIERLLGFDVKLRQYEAGKRFCDAVAARGGIERLNAVWAAPEALPSGDELKHPERWLERTTPRPLESGAG